MTRQQGSWHQGIVLFCLLSFVHSFNFQRTNEPQLSESSWRSKTEAAELKRTGEILEAAEKEHIAGKNILHRSLQVCSKPLHAHVNVQQHFNSAIVLGLCAGCPWQYA